MSWGEWPEKEGRHTRQTRRIYVPRRSSNPWERLSSAAPAYHPSFSSQISNPAVSFPNRGRNDRFRSGGVTSSDKTQNTEENPFRKIDEAETENVGINFEAYEDIPVEASGEDLPPPVSTFLDLDLGHGLNLNIRRCKYVRPTPIQRHAIPIVMAGRDLMACAQTGSGKTAAFCFPIISGVSKIKAMERGGGARGRGGRNRASPVALILSPTRELASQIHEEAKKFAFQTGVKVHVVYGGAPIYFQLRELSKGVDVLVATPGRLVDMINRGNISLQRIKYLTLDEADRMLDMGFEPQIRKIVAESGMPSSGVRQTMLFSATFPDEIQRLASDFMSNYIFLSVGRVGSSTDLIEQKVEYVKDMDKRDCLMGLLCGQQANGTNGKLGLTLIFVETKRGADLLERWLLSNGFSATAIHGNKIQMEREQALRSFKNGSCPILVATDVAARGLDVPSVKHVINFDFPKNIDDYVHRIGRTGRAGKSGIATAFFNENNASLAKSLVEIMKEAKQEVPTWLSDFAEAEPYEGSGRRGGFGGRDNFGGYDFRKSGNFGNGFDGQSFSSNYGDVSSSVNTGSGWKFDSGDENRAGNWKHSTIPSNACASQPYEPGYESIVATGWD